MAFYQLLPNKARVSRFAPFVTWPDALQDAEVESLLNYIDNTITLQDGVVGVGELESNVRRSKVGWIPQSPETMWLYDRLAFIARSINSDFYEFDLFGFVEDLQFSLYHSDDAGTYDWHMDMGENSSITRKLSLVIQLSDPEEYEGGDLLINNGASNLAVEKKKGMLAAFPSFTLHKVSPVTSGIRRSLVVWIGGPAFR